MGNIVVKNISKAYKHYPTRFGRLIDWLNPFAKPHYKLKWVLQDLNFDVKAGESVGIIGINGAGKSTLLKLITGTTQPTKGTVTLNGRVAALLELGMGFHPDFTGRQNAYLSGQLLGLSKNEIDELMPSIEAFADIGDYIDRPIRIYSSGMQVRLAFSVATAVRPDILIVDEALSVGDIAFQHKSFERIRDFRRQGTTLLIVSHDKQAIMSICDKAILLNGGKLEQMGTPETIMDLYNALIVSNQKQDLETNTLADGKTQTISGTKEARILSIDLLNSQGSPIKIVDVGQEVTIQVQAIANVSLPRLILGLIIKDRTGQVVYGTNTFHLNQSHFSVQKNEQVEFNLSFAANLGPGSYSVTVALTGSENHQLSNYEWRDLALVFQVTNSKKDTFIGTSWLNPKTTITKRTE